MPKLFYESKPITQAIGIAPIAPHIARTALLYAGALVIALCYHAYFLHTFNHWWTDDDPLVFGTAGYVTSPLKFLYDRSVIHSFAAPNTLMPMSGITTWVDSHIAFRSVRLAQFHHCLSLSVVLTLLFANFVESGLSRLEAALLTALWLMFPSTVIVNGLLAARHHLEGLLWSLAAILTIQKLVHRKQSGVVALPLGLFLMALAMLSKETYALFLPPLLFALLWLDRRKAAALSYAAIIPFYIVYRTWAVGLTARYHAPLVTPGEFVSLLLRLPYIAVGNWTGYFAAAVLIGFAGVALYRRRPTLDLIIVISALIVCAVAPLYPIAYQLTNEWRAHDTWSRALLITDTALLWGGALLLARGRMRVIQRFILLLVVPGIVAGGLVTAGSWNQTARLYAREGKFYLHHPDRLLYSESPAFWFLEGVRHLYKVPSRHHVAVHDPSLPLDQQLANFQTIWHWNGHRFIADDQLFDSLKHDASP